MRYTFEWDPIKARENRRKHGVDFESAAEIFLDPLAGTMPDQKHSEEEQRWVTIGSETRGRILVLFHTFTEVSAEECIVRIISARKATKHESAQYEEA